MGCVINSQNANNLTQWTRIMLLEYFLDALHMIPADVSDTSVEHTVV